MSPLIYLDNSTTTSPSSDVIQEMLPYLYEKWGDPSSFHSKGRELYLPLEQGLRWIYSLVSAKEKDTFLFTSSASEAIFQVFYSIYREVTLKTGKNQFLVSAEDPALLAAARQLEAFGCKAKLLDLSSQGTASVESLIDALSPRTALLALPLVNGLTGVIQPLPDIAEICRERGIALLVEGTHALGKIPFTFEDLEADYLSLSGEHIHGPKGTGGLYIREGAPCHPLIAGGELQRGLRGGGFNVPGFMGLAKAAKEAIETRDFLSTEIARLRDLLEMGILARFPDALAPFSNLERGPHCTTVIFPELSDELLFFYLQKRGVCATLGRSPLPLLRESLKNYGFSPHLAYSALSFSLSRYTTEQEISLALQKIEETVLFLKKFKNENN